MFKQAVKKALAVCGFELHPRNTVTSWPQLLDNAEGVQLKRTTPNPLEQFFDSHTEGPGIFKWRHYFEIYHDDGGTDLDGTCSLQRKHLMSIKWRGSDYSVMQCAA